MPEIINRVGQELGRLKITEFAGRHSTLKCSMWKCRCECGREFLISSSNWRRRKQKTCGCERHLLSHTPEYAIWQSMIGRCHRERNNAFKDYGARGISVCERWRASFADFFADVGRRPAPGLTIERKNNHGNYEPGNVVWATTKEQARNKRNNRLITFRGETHCLIEWAEITGIPHDTIKQRLGKLGWPVKKALTARVLNRGPKKAVAA